MAKEFPVGTIRHWESGDVIKAYDPIQPYSSGWINLKTSPELERIGFLCDREASTIKNYKLPINGEKFLDHEIDEFRDENDQKLFDADSFKQYEGYESAGRYAFRNEFSRRFMQNTMRLDEFVSQRLADANDEAGGDKYLDKLSPEEKRRIRAEARIDFKEEENPFTVGEAIKLSEIVTKTLEQIKEGLDFKDETKKKAYEEFKLIVDTFPESYEKLQIKRKQKNLAIKIMEPIFADNWGVRESLKDYAETKFDEYVKRYADQIAKDSLEEQMQQFGVTVDMPTEEFYSKIYRKIRSMNSKEIEEYDSFKELIYLRFLKRYNTPLLRHYQ